MSSPPPAAPNGGAGADRLFQLVTAGAAWLVLIVLGAAAASMAWDTRSLLPIDDTASIPPGETEHPHASATNPQFGGPVHFTLAPM